MAVPEISRRTALGLLGAGAAAVVVAACSPGGGGGADGGAASLELPAGGAPLPAPTELRSAAGALDVDLAATPVMVPWGSGQRYALAYAGSVPGPTLRVRPGDTLRITLRNGLDVPTNLHTHGLHVSPEGDADDLFVMVDPGGTHSYRYEIPADHPPGLFWYHPHHHGEVADQVSAGMAGAIVVEAPETPVGASDRVLVISDPRIGSDAAALAVSTAEKQMGREGDVVLVNGAVAPTISPQAGTLERWRILNACASRFLVLSLSSGRLTLAGTDQGALDRPVELDELRLVPGQRAELLVPVGTDPLTLRAATVARGGMGMGGSGMGGGGMMGGGSSASSSAGSATPTALLEVRPTGTGEAPAVVAPTPPARPDVSGVSATRTVTMGAMGMGSGQFVIDGRSFDAGRIDVTAALGTVEEWTITNVSMMDHPFHLHVWPFRVVSRSDGAPDPGWRDTVNVPAGGWVRLRIPFADLAGTTVFHCHILDHEDLGMMATIRVA